MVHKFSESDWKLFRARLPGWQEKHMESLVRDYAQLLADPNQIASDKFWALEKRIRQDRTHVGVVADMRRSNMYVNLLSLLQEGAITMDDLEGFSDDLLERLSFMMSPR